jgi:hypothetical protein
LTSTSTGRTYDELLGTCSLMLPTSDMVLLKSIEGWSDSCERECDEEELRECRCLGRCLWRLTRWSLERTVFLLTPLGGADIMILQTGLLLLILIDDDS